MKAFGFRERGGFVLWVALLTVSLWPVVDCNGSMRPADAETIRQMMDTIIDVLDSSNYGELVSWDEHVVLVYELTQRREPSHLEFFLLQALRDTIGMRRSTVLSVALRGERRNTTWAQCRDFVRRVRFSDFQVDSRVRGIARRLGAIQHTEIIEALRQMENAADMTQPIGQPQREPPVQGIRYKTYFGYLHAHSNLSDGQGDPLEAYTYAQLYGDLDFFALTDHGEDLDIWPWEDKWEELVDAAEALNQPGTYTTLWGFEWSNPILGHISVLNTPDYTNAIFTPWITEFYDWLMDRPEGFGRYNHPGEYDGFSAEFLHMELHPVAVPQMVGMETWNGNKSFDTYYYDGSWESSYSYWDEGNRQGWYLGALGGQDNHHPDWGTHNDFRTAVLATGLSREQIIEAYRNRRFYATEDKDLYLDFRCQGYPMGSHLYGVERRFKVKARDKSGDTFKEVRLYRNGELVKTKTVSGRRIRVRFKDLSRTGHDYYYVIVQQNDDNDDNGRNDEAISSPIWID